MTVLIVPSWYTAKPNQQLGAFFREQALVLKKQGVDVIVAESTLKGSKTSILYDNYKLRKVNDEGLITYIYTTLAMGAWRVPILATTRQYNNLKKIYRKIRKDKIKIDLIHAHSFFPAGVAAIRLGKKYDIPVIVTEHSSGILSRRIDRVSQALLRYTVEKADAFICVSEALKEAVYEYTSTTKKIRVISNMVDSRFVISREEYSNEKVFSFVSIGNLIQGKRFDLTIDAFQKAFAGNANVHLHIVGDGVLKNQLQQRVKDLNIESQVSFCGRISREKVIEILQSANAFVLPSDFETFGVVYIEAMACGVPVIATRNGGANDIVSKSDGYLVEINNLEQLEKAMRNMYHDIEKFDSYDIAKRCREKFGEQSVSEQIIKLYEEIIKECAK